MKNDKKGFITVATGSEKYYQLAANLYMSYKMRGSGKYPFAIVCDRQNRFTQMFDDVVLVQDISKSTMDKLLMKSSPYDQSIFIDADTLIVQDIDDLWNIYENQDDVSAFGCTLPLDSKAGWFTYEGSGKYKSQVKYLISMNGGIYYFRKNEKSEQVFLKAAEIIGEYSTIDFKYFSHPQDEPLMAMAMVINDCLPCTVHYDMIILPGCEKVVSVDYEGNIYEGKKISGAKLIHFSSPRTELFLYNYLNKLNYRQIDRNRWTYLKQKIKYLPKELKFNLLHLGGAILRRIGLDKEVDQLKKVIQ